MANDWSKVDAVIQENLSPLPQPPPYGPLFRASADCTVSLTKDTFEAVASGEENTQMAFMSGKLKVDGERGIAMQLV